MCLCSHTGGRGGPDIHLHMCVDAKRQSWVSFPVANYLIFEVLSLGPGVPWFHKAGCSASSENLPVSAFLALGLKLQKSTTPNFYIGEGSELSKMHSKHLTN